MGITQKEIARDLGVSFITVSRALNDSGCVSRELKKHILDYAKERSYVPHRASQILVRNKIRRIAFFSSIGPAYFFDDISRGVQNAAEELKHFNYEFNYFRIAFSDTKKYIRILKHELENGIEGAAFVNQMQYNMDKIITLVEKAGIPFIMFNRDDPRANRLCFIGPNYPAGGRLAANFIGRSLLKKRGKVLVLNDAQWKDREKDAAGVSTERFMGFLDVLTDQYPSVKMYTEDVNCNDNEQKNSLLYKILKKYEHTVDAVYLNFADNRMFIQVIEDLDYKDCIVILHDFDEFALKGIERDILTAVVYQDPVLQGYMAAKTMEKILESKTREQLPNIETAHTLIFKENLNFLQQIRIP